MSTRSRLIFLDVGGHLGQTLDEVLSGCYGFDMVHTFEPMPQLAGRLKKQYHRHIEECRLSVHDCGLSNRNADVTLYGDNADGGASLHAGKANGGAAALTTVQVMRATEFFMSHLQPNDRILMKLNCEGAEGEILFDLIESGQIHRITDVMIDFDLFKIPGRRHEPFEVLRRLKDVGFSDFHLALDVMVGPTHRDRIRNWLAYVEQKTPVARIPHLFDGLPRQARRLKRALRHVQQHTLGFLDAGPFRRAG